ncbi:MAG: hypothetical protein AAGH41_00380 [Pseudomonadota bacterium]
MIRRIVATSALSLFGSLCFAGPSFAASLVSNPFETFTVQDFSGFPSEFTGGPRESGVDGDSVIFTSTSRGSVFAYSFAYSLNTNGDWGGRRDGFVGLNATVGTIRFTFDRAVSGVGGLINYAPPAGSNGEAIIRVLGEGDRVLETFNLTQDAPIVTPGALDVGAFRGIERNRADILAFELSSAFIVIDDLTWSRDNADSAVPVPAAGLLFLSAGAFISANRSKRKRA